MLDSVLSLSYMTLRSIALLLPRVTDILYYSIQIKFKGNNGGGLQSGVYARILITQTFTFLEVQEKNKTYLHNKIMVIKSEVER